MPLTLSTMQQVVASIENFDGANQSGDIIGIPNPPPTYSWSIADTSIATLSAGTGTSVLIIGQAVGSTNVTVSDGTHSYTDTVTVTAPEVESIGIAYATPALKGG